MLTGVQIRQGRKLMGWSQDQLAAAAAVMRAEGLGKRRLAEGTGGPSKKRLRQPDWCLPAKTSSA